MTTREEYNTCMKPYISGAGKPPEERKLGFCIGAKMCSGKARTSEEAKTICLNAPPKEPKPRKGRKRSERLNCGQDMAELATCVTKNLNMDDMTATSFRLILAETLLKCRCGKEPEHGYAGLPEAGG